MFQGGLSHELYFIAIDNRGQVIIGPNKKIVVMHVVRELEVLIWFMRTWMLKWGYCYDQHLLYAVWTRVKDNDNMIGCAISVSISASCSRCDILASTLCIMTYLHHVLWTLSLWTSIIYSIDTVLYPYTLPIKHTPIPSSSLCLSCNLSQA